jgi:uncharacterized protein (TIGR01777 family)
MRVVIAGSSGFLGHHLVEELRGRGHDVVRLVRRAATTPDEVQWDPAAGQLDQATVDGAEVVVNLAGAATFGNPHSGTWQRALRESRVQTTLTIARAVAASERPPAYLAGNAVGWYGDHGKEPVPEDADSRGETLMTSVCRDWQAAADPAVASGARVCFLRTSPVLDRESPPLRELRHLFRFGLGARLSDGSQYFPVISLRDWVGAVAFLAENDGVSGPVNLSCPETPTNAEFTKALAEALGRPAFLRIPGPVLSVAAGELAPELLGSTRVEPRVLVDAGYRFEDADVGSVLAAGLA